MSQKKKSVPGSDKGMGWVEKLRFLSDDQLSLLKNELRLYRRISGIERDVLWMKKILFYLWIPVLLNLALNFLRR